LYIWKGYSPEQRFIHAITVARQHNIAHKQFHFVVRLCRNVIVSLCIAAEKFCIVTHIKRELAFLLTSLAFAVNKFYILRRGDERPYDDYLKIILKQINSIVLTRIVGNMVFFLNSIIRVR